MRQQFASQNPNPKVATMFPNREQVQLSKLASSPSYALNDTIYLRNPFTDIKDSRTSRYLIFVICGNPGLIEYYRGFMTCLYSELTKRDSETDNGDGASETTKVDDESEDGLGQQSVVFEVYGRSMGGFELGAAPGAEKGKKRSYYDLNQQIAFVEERLLECVTEMSKSSQGRPPKVILVGHSVGSYILLEIVRRHRERLEKRRKRRSGGVKWRDQAGTSQVLTEEETSSGGSGSGTSGSEEEKTTLLKRRSTRKETKKELKGARKVKVEPDVVGGICLFPTVVEIGQSKRGRVLTVSSA